MKTYAVGLDERIDTTGEHFYIAPCGSCHILQLDGRENIQKHMQSTIECMSKRGFPNFVIIHISSLLDYWQSHIIWKQIHKNIEIILD